tara:strand:+ start:371 stop:796 length:426 start_codon:yes stop_codon:yes gene_type:complete
MSVVMYPLSIEDRNGMIQIYSDFHKDAYGFRPRHINVSALSDEQLDEDFKTFSEQFDKNEKNDAKALECDSNTWDKLITKTIGYGADDYKTALRWVVDGADDWDAEAIVWSHGLLYSDKGRNLVKEINEVCDDILRKVYER